MGIQGRAVAGQAGEVGKSIEILRAGQEDPRAILLAHTFTIDALYTILIPTYLLSAASESGQQAMASRLGHGFCTVPDSVLSAQRIWGWALYKLKLLDGWI